MGKRYMKELISWMSIRNKTVVLTTMGEKAVVGTVGDIKVNCSGSYASYCLCQSGGRRWKRNDRRTEKCDKCECSDRGGRYVSAEGYCLVPAGTKICSGVDYKRKEPMRAENLYFAPQK